MTHENSFPLTEIQEAFYVGRTLGAGVGTQVQLEFEVDDLDVPRMEEAWNRLVRATDMLRVTVTPDAKQSVAAQVPHYRIEVTDLSALPVEELERVRNSASGFDPSLWPLFAIRVALLGNGRARVFFAIDELVADGPSVSLLLQQWHAIYRGDTEPAPGITFRDYVEATAVPPARLERALGYWRGKLADARLDSPAPFVKEPNGDDTLRRRLSTALTAAEWTEVKQVASAAKATPSALLLALYTAALGGARPVVLTTYNRTPVHPDVARLVGPFISTAIFLAPEEEGTLAERTHAVQQQLWSDLENSAVSGIRAHREWTRQDRSRSGRAVPVVFTSLLGSLTSGDVEGWAGRVDDSSTITHTPGVHIEQCVQPGRNGGLVLSWDIATGVLDEVRTEQAFSRLSDVLRNIARDGVDVLKKPVTELFAGQEDVTGLPLTEVQSAYLAGRAGELAGTAETRVYQEFRLKGHDVDRLEQAWRKLIGHHPALRGTVQPDGTLTIRAEVPAYEIARHDLTGCSVGETDRRLAEVAQRMRDTPFGLGGFPMYALEASLLPGGDIVLHTALDALLADAQSFALLFGQLFALSEGKDVLGREAGGLAEYLRGVAERASGPQGEKAAVKWSEKFAALPSGPPIADSGERTHRRFDIEWTTLNKRAEAIGVPADMLLLTAYTDALREEFKEPFTTVVVSWDRPAGTSEIVGDFTGLSWLAVDDTLPDKFDDRAREIWARVRADLECGAQRSGLGQLRQRVFRSKGALRLPLVFTRVPDVPRDLHSDSVEMLVSQSQTAQVGLDNVPLLVGDTLVCQWDAAADALPATRLTELFASYERRMRSLDAPKWTIVEHLEESLKSNADLPAIRWDGAVISYGELDRRSSQLARHLIRHGCQVGDHVAVHMDRSADLVVALVAVVRAGGVYVPVDPVNPPDRVRYLVEDSGARLMIADGARANVAAGAHVICPDRDAALLAEEPDTAPGIVVTPDDPIYMIYTSGSTGLPKGCPNSHRGVTNRLVWMQETFPLTVQDRVLQKTPYGFDVSAWEFFWPLITGASIVVARPGGHVDTSYLAGLIRAESVTVTHFVPSVLGMFLREPSAGLCTSLRYVFASGEALPVGTMKSFFDVLGGSELHNLYGPTEAAIDVTHWPCRKDWDEPTVPIGHSIDNIGIHIVDSDLAEVSPGTQGEICISGYGVALGYHNRPELTAERFVSTSYAARLYRTGDLGVVAPDGEIRYLGRIDNQFKLRGLRIEPEEIEAALVSRVGLADARVLPVTGEDDEPNLAAVCVASGTVPSVSAIRRALKDVLPSYMVPNLYRFVDALPLTPNGKLDRKVATALFREVEEPEPGGLLATVSSIVAGALGIPAVAPDADLFDLGATSFTAIRIAQEIERVTGSQVPVDALIDTPTVAGLVAVLGGATETPAETGFDADTVAEIAAELLGIEEIGLDADLFDLGATSFTMIRLAQALGERYGAEVPVDVLIDSPTSRGIAAGLGGKPAAEQKSDEPKAADIRIAFDPEAKKAFKEAKISERRISEDVPRLPLNAQPSPLDLFEASSFRDFTEEPLPATSLLELLALTASGEIDGRVKRGYPSAGGFYPVQVYVYVRQDRVAGIAGGLYYVHPGERTLIRIESRMNVTEQTQVRHNQALVGGAAFGLFLVSTPAAIAPAYGERLAVKYAGLEAGHISQLLMTAAPAHGLGMCPVGEMDFDSIRRHFQLDDDQDLLVSLWGGALGETDVQRRARLTSGETASEVSETESIAVIGFAAKLPGADSLDELGELLADGGTAIGPVPEQRWNPLRLNAKRAGATVGGYLDDVTSYEGDEFGITEAEAAAIDPQERLLLTTTRWCLEDAGVTKARLAKSGPVGVFVGAMWADHALYGVTSRADGEAGTHATRGSLAHRISHAFDLTGPSVVLDSGCVSGLAAIDAAVKAIRGGQCTSAVAAASNLVLHPDHLDVLSELGLVAEETDSCAFTDRASGWIVGEGVGAVLLKPLSQALADGDPVHAVIRGGAVRHSGTTRQFGLPSRKRQEETVRAALADAGVTPDAVGYVEAAASGAALADALEVAGLGHVFTDPVIVGSVKPVVGHLEASSVFAQLGKVICQFRTGRIHPTRLTSEPNPNVLSVPSVELAREASEWKPRPDADGEFKKRALINGFAGTGSYGCLVVEEPPAFTQVPDDEEYLLPLSADTSANLAALAEALSEVVDEFPLASVVRTLREGRVNREERAVVVATRQNAAERLRQLSAAIRAGDRVVGEASPQARWWLDGGDAEWPAAPGVRRVSLPPTPLRLRGTAVAAPEPDTSIALDRLVQIVRAETGIAETSLPPDADLLALGVTSRQLQRIAARVTAAGGGHLPLETLFETDNIADLAVAAFGGNQ
uniref:Pyoverdine sidechain non-ribosomal peptide synthetase PvdD n=1 Tax=uncultured bacterium esnapd10 TaxID=1366590 RepID=S5TKW5_9BACT|nr:pyoverdine sidechain non-ribosomal peptide synthetase PvdD [uncultured bacterium esnapd10]